jgi:hypothetical protein
LTGPLATVDVAKIAIPGVKVILDPRPWQWYRDQFKFREDQPDQPEPETYLYLEKDWKRLWRGLMVMPIVKGGYMKTLAAQYCLILQPARRHHSGMLVRAPEELLRFHRVGLFVIDSLSGLCINDPRFCHDERCGLTGSDPAVTRRCLGTAKSITLW